MASRESKYERMVEPEDRRKTGKAEMGGVQHLPHTEESREEEERVNPPETSNAFYGKFIEPEDIPNWFNDMGIDRDDDLSIEVKNLIGRFNTLQRENEDLAKETLQDIMSFKKPHSQTPNYYIFEAK